MHARATAWIVLAFALATGPSLAFAQTRERDDDSVTGRVRAAERGEVTAPDEPITGRTRDDVRDRVPDGVTTPDDDDFVAPDTSREFPARNPDAEFRPPEPNPTRPGAPREEPNPMRPGAPGATGVDPFRPGGDSQPPTPTSPAQPPVTSPTPRP
jgi:hypothetical protein